MNSMTYKSSGELKALAKEHMFGRYGTAIGATLTISMITGFITFFSTIYLNTMTLTGVILNYLISFVISVLTGVFHSGQNYFFLKISCGRPVTVSDVFYGFKMFPDKAVTMQLFLSICIYLGLLPATVCNYLLVLYPQNAVLILVASLALILYGVIGVVVSLNYAQSFFLLHDFPNYSAKELLSTSRKLMKGNKGRFFYLLVSFLPLMLLGLLSCGIAYLWLIPYMNATEAEFFLDLVRTKKVSD